eukprot:scaffold604_cov384-Prasinococcus_capsulatus_cf.AAC.19
MEGGLNGYSFGNVILPANHRTVSTAPKALSRHGYKFQTTQSAATSDRSNGNTCHGTHRPHRGCPWRPPARSASLGCLTATGAP